MGNAYQPVDSGTPEYLRLDRCEVEHHVGGAGQLLQNGVAERRADKVDVGMQVVVRVGRDTGDRVAGGDQLPGRGTSEQSGDAGQQDPHARTPPRPLSRHNDFRRTSRLPVAFS